MTIAIQTTRIQDVYPVDRPAAPADAPAVSAVALAQAGVDGGSADAGSDGAGAWADGSVAESYQEARRVAAMRAMALRQAAGTGGAAQGPPPMPIAVAPAATIAPLVLPDAAELAEAAETARKRHPHPAAEATSAHRAPAQAAVARAAVADPRAAAPQGATTTTAATPAAQPQGSVRLAARAEQMGTATHRGGAPLGYLLGAHA